MQVRYIGHASILVESAGIRLLCDPWWSGSAYTGQWVPYPLPAPQAADASPDFVYISHGHEDHLHVPTLSSIDRRAALLIPRQRDAGLRDFLRSLGFQRVYELDHGRTRRLAPGFDVTLYANKDDSILVVSSEGRTLVNANDALHASARHVIDHFCEQIRARHGRIETLLLGYGGASWFPNCMRPSDGPQYDAVARERAFTENFAYVARQLEPAIALPFAASFVLLEDRLRWINRARYDAPSPCDELRRQGAHRIQTHFLMPGDRVINGRIVSAGANELSCASADADIDRIYAAEIQELRATLPWDETRLQALLEAWTHNARTRAARLLAPGQHLTCRIDITDMPEHSILMEAGHDGAQVERCDRLRFAPLVLSARLAVLEAWATQEYGYESLSIGYGGVLHGATSSLRSRNMLLALLGRKPLPATRAQQARHFLRHPVRALRMWRSDLHWRRLSLRLRQGDAQRWNDLYSADPDLWSPLREAPLPLRRSA